MPSLYTRVKWFQKYECRAGVQAMRRLLNRRDSQTYWACRNALCQVLSTAGNRAAPETSDAVKLSSCPAGLLGCGGECSGFVVVLAGGQAVVEAAEEAAEQVALGSGVPVSGIAAAVVVGAGAG